MLIEHKGKQPVVHQTAFVAPNAVICGDVTLEENVQIAFGAVVVAQGKPIRIGKQTIVGENAVIRSSTIYPVNIGKYVRVGPNAALYGCTVEDEVFLATGVTIFQGTVLKYRSEVRINGVVHVGSVLPEKSMVPISWVAVGNPAEILPPNEHDRVWEIQKDLDFPMKAYGVARSSDGSVDMKAVTRYLYESTNEHRNDRIIG